MHQIILYPTETLYGLGVNALDPAALDLLLELKGRERTKTPSWLVRSLDDIRQFAEVSDPAERIAERFLPGPLTLVLPALPSVAGNLIAPDRTIAFRISSDPVARQVTDDFWKGNQAPLTCTSANVSGSPCLPTPTEILQQFGAKASEITRVIDDGSRKGLASTVVRVVGDEVRVLREGDVSERTVEEAAA